MRQIGFVPSADFNPRFHEGSDGADLVCDIGCILISIHAPTRGATMLDNGNKGRREISIHAPTRGATGAGSAWSGADGYFNPRSHEGSDKIIRILSMLQKISIHAPARGATIRSGTRCRICYDFNPRSREGSDDQKDYYSVCREYFNPRSREGSDHSRYPYPQNIDDFNPRSREGSDGCVFV